jgi:hypothetical protein
MNKDKIEKSSGVNIKNTRYCLITRLEPTGKSKWFGLSVSTKSGQDLRDSSVFTFKRRTL